MELLVFLLEITIRFVDNISQIIKINISREVNEIIAPIEDNMFHVVYESG